MVFIMCTIVDAAGTAIRESRVSASGGKEIYFIPSFNKTDAQR